MSPLTKAALFCAAIAALASVSLFGGAIRAQVRSLPDRAGESVTPSVIVKGVELPRASDAFVDSIGVNLHLHFFDTNYYTRYGELRTLILKAHVRHVRDGLIDTTWKGYYERLSDLAEAGARADLITSVGQSQAFIRSYPARVRPGTIESIEAPNEYNTSNNANWAADLTAFQKMLYQTVRTSDDYRNVRVVGPSLTKPDAYAAVGNLNDYLDEGNSHPYPAGREPGTRGWGFIGSLPDYGSLDWNLRAARQTSGAKPVYVTETGYGDADAVPEGVPGAVKARYVLRLYLEAWNAGVARTYLYQFLDAGHDGFESYGIVDDAMRPKPAYTALKNLIVALRDPVPAFRISALDYTLEGPPRLHHTLLERHDGSYALVLWSAVSSWDTGARKPIATQPLAATLAFKNIPRRVDTTTFDESGQTVSRSIAPRRSLTLPISDNVTIVDLR
jgi:hypothetical protein